jgi:hypothetical protein
VRADNRDADGTNTLNTHAQTKNVVGTGPYMAPECKLY